MCSHYQALRDSEKYRLNFHVRPPSDLGKEDLWPGYIGSFIRRPRAIESGDAAAPPGEALAGRFGLVPHWATDEKIARHTFNCRSETAASKPSFRDAWRLGQRCIIPAEAIYEPDWRSGKAIATRISRVDGLPMGIAGLWSSWNSAQGMVFSYTMLTINAAAHPLMNQWHKPADEKRMVVILQDDAYGDWLEAAPGTSLNFMRQFPAELLEWTQ